MPTRTLTCLSSHFTIAFSLRCLNAICEGLCEHLYTCDCEDRHRLCKHIHKIHSSQKIDKEVEIDEDVDQQCFQAESIIEPENYRVTEEEKFQRNIETLIEICKKDKVRQLRLPSINRQLEDLIQQCRAVATLNSDDFKAEPMKPSETFAPNEKLDHQVKFFKTRKEAKKGHTEINFEDITNDLKKANLQKLIPRLKAKQNDLLLTFNATNIYYSSLLSLEVSFPEKKRNVRTGWLSDEIIDAFLFTLKVKFKHVTFCGCTEAMMLMKGKSLKRLWFQENISRKKIIFIPLNQNQVHWVLIAIFVEENKLVYLDPMDGSAKPNKLCIDMCNRLLEEKFEKTIKLIEVPEHVLQNDSRSCGVYCCFYASQICSSKSLKIQCNSNAQRKLIYETIVQNCSLDPNKDYESFCKACLEPVNKVSDISWVKCMHCPAWFHCRCVSMTEEEAAGNPHFRCPSAGK